MSYVTRTLVLLLVGLFMMTASASADDRLTVSGLVDNIITVTDNLSLADRNFTSLSLGSPQNPGQAGDADSLTYAVTRFNLRFTIEAGENSKAVAQVHADKEWGKSGVLFNDFEYSHGQAAAAYGGAFAVEGFWFEGLLPGTAAKFELGFPYFSAEFGGFSDATKIFNTAAPGVTLSAPFSDTISTYTWFAWLGQDFDGFGPTWPRYYHDGGGEAEVIDVDGNRVSVAKSTKLMGDGDDWAAGTRAQFTLMDGLALDLVYAIHMDEAAAGATGDTTRHWIQGKVWYQYGDFSLTPSLTMYLSDTDGGGDTESFLFELRGKYAMGAMSLEGRIAYTPASDDDQNRDYGILGVWGIPQSVVWFALMGNHDLTYLGPAYARSIQTSLRQDSHGMLHAAAKADYTLSPQTTLSVSVGLFNAAEDTSGVPGGLADTGAEYAGGSHIATEVDAWLAYQLYSNATINLWAAYAMTGDGLDLEMDGMVAESQDVVGAGALVRYTF